jgi:FtsZ-interacting cell division protein ZipA
MATPTNVSGLAVIFLVVAAVFGFLNSHKMKALRTNVASVKSAKDAPYAHAQTARAAKAEAALAQAEKEKTDLQGKLDASQQEIDRLKQGAVGANDPAAGNAATPAENAQNSDLQSQVDDLRKQLESAEKEKALLAEKLEDASQRSVQAKESSQPKESKKKHESTSIQRENVASHRAGVHGTVLAYNQAYNFVVLNLGARNGVEPNSEMLVLRDGTLIGKIRISSVEPATAIGDIISNSLARGVQVQPGDNVIYAGTSP